jgi:hypothetical protein
LKGLFSPSTASIVSPMLTDMGFDSEIEKAIIVMAIAAGAVVSG